VQRPGATTDHQLQLPPCSGYLTLVEARLTTR
jgi:hypothetical protein